MLSRPHLLCRRKVCSGRRLLLYGSHVSCWYPSHRASVHFRNRHKRALEQKVEWVQVSTACTCQLLEVPSACSLARVYVCLGDVQKAYVDYEVQLQAELRAEIEALASQVTETSRGDLEDLLVACADITEQAEARRTKDLTVSEDQAKVGSSTHAQLHTYSNTYGCTATHTHTHTATQTQLHTFRNTHGDIHSNNTNTDTTPTHAHSDTHANTHTTGSPPGE